MLLRVPLVPPAFSSDVGSLEGQVGAVTERDGPTVTRTFQAAVSAAGLPHQRFHDLRHAAATLLLEAGEELGVVSRILGHATVSLTMDTYSHLTDRMTRARSRPDGRHSRSGVGVQRGYRPEFERPSGGDRRAIS